MLSRLYGPIIALRQTDKLDDGLIPPPRVLYTIDTFRSALVGLDDRSRHRISDLTEDEIVSEIQRWRVRIALDLAKLLNADATVKSAGDILVQVGSIFRCGDCGTSGGMTFSSVFDHDCLKRELAFPFPDRDEAMMPSRWLDALACEPIARAVVDAVDLDPDTTRLDDVEDRLFLLNVWADRRIARDLRERISAQPHSYADLVRASCSRSRSMTRSLCSSTSTMKRSPSRSRSIRAWAGRSRGRR